MLLIAVEFSSFLTNSIPQIGQVPGLSLIISGCIEQVQSSFFWTFSTITAFLFLQAAKRTGNRQQAISKHTDCSEPWPIANCQLPIAHCLLILVFIIYLFYLQDSFQFNLHQ